MRPDCVLMLCGCLLWSTSANAAYVRFAPDSYYGAPSERAADRDYFSKLLKRLDDRPYVTARAQLLRLGFRPARLSRLSKDYYCLYNDELRSRYPEIIACTSLGVSGHAFAFARPHGGYAIVVTYGEERLKVTNIRAATRDDLHRLRQRLR